MAQVTGRKDELQRIEKETAELRKKVEERRRRNEEHLAILNKRRDVIETQKKEVDAKDAKLQDNLNAFLTSRDESKKQLQEAIRKIEDTIPQEQDVHHAKVRQLKSRIAEMTASIEAEAKSWALEMAMREWNQKSDARKWLLEEVNAAEGGKDTWADVVHEINSIQTKDSLQSLNEIRSIISV
ncbi:hypothetical protein STCU_02823 [Strigomonas culicis]|nr:hypothetical protein STCU_03228 [Strigomonas culicis]EPY32414.1 hypothetical protein STCU_02823 [Strigomonas culicis]|eukprot:EPY31797.1 hypothetical protein STCU_03228 [Strigomonas culicis]